MKEKSKPIEKKLISVNTASEMYGMSLWWFYRAAREGRIPHYRVGTRLLFKPSELETFFGACRQELKET